MPESLVTIKLTAQEYRFLRNELEMLEQDLHERANTSKLGRERTGIDKRRAQLKFMLEKM